jgi:acetyltransferase-like isoleucine patch superfamily enzyme
VVEKLKAKVRFWVDGAEIVHWDDPRNTLTWDVPSFATVRMLESIPGEGASVHLGAYSGIHYTATVITGGQHHLDWVSLLHAHEGADGHWEHAPRHVIDHGPVRIGSDAWVGFEALIMSGVTIGHGAAVAARAVVTKDVEPYSVVGGNPARHIRYRFDEPTREALLRIAWWDWSKAKVRAHAGQIHSPEVAEFVRKHDPDDSACELCARPTW